MDITLEISRLQTDYDTAMKWADISKDDNERQANYFLSAASAQNELCKLIPDQTMKARYAKERDRLMALAARLKGIELPASSTAPVKVENTKKNAVSNNPAIPVSVSEPAKMPEKNTQKDSDTIYTDIDLSGVCCTDPKQMKMGLNEMDGIDAEKEKVINFFKHREEKKLYQKLDAAAKGIGSVESKINMLIYGPPGTGKSSFLSAIGKYVLETQEDSAFFMLTPDVFRDKGYGQSDKIIRKVFHDAAQYKTALICIDEISTLCPSNKENMHGADRSTLNTFLNLTDGVKRASDTSDVILIAGTNYPWDVDKAAISRLSEQLYFGLPNKEGRKKFFLNHASSFLAADPTDQERIADQLAERTEHADYRVLNQLAGLLYDLSWRKTLAANPYNKEVDTFIPATAEELDRIVREVKIKYDEAYIRRLQDPDLWYAD